MTSRPLSILGLVIILVAVVAAIGFVMNGDDGSPTNPDLTDPNATTTSSTATSTATSTVPVQTASIVFASTTIPVPLPAATSSIDTSAWQIYVSHEAGFSIEYPANLVDSVDAGVLTLTFPKNAYFRWPLQDDARVSVSVKPACPDVPEGYERFEPVKFVLGGREFTRTIATDVGAGQRYLEIAYDTLAAGNCYHVSFFNRGGNGAGLYVDNTSLIRKYDAEHAKDLGSAIAIANAMVGTLRILAPAP